MAFMPRMQRGRGAQRLSASKRVARPLSQPTTWPALMCSTPFGIKESRTPPLRTWPASSSRAQRLSASKRVARGPSGWCGPHSSGAQRLSASKRVAQGEPFALFKYQNPCSTPFGIKESRTSRFGLACRPCRPVLNAFRHQRESHIPKHRRQSHSPRVLNAFRHQRESHRDRGKTQAAAVVVLNAFRHQRESHRKRGQIVRFED